MTALVFTSIALIAFQVIYEVVGLWVMTAPSPTEKAMNRSARRFIRHYLDSHEADYLPIRK